MGADSERWLEMGRLAELGIMYSELVHELRQPIFALKAQAQLLRSRAAPGDAELIDGLLDQALHLEELLGRYAISGRRVNGVLQPVLLSEAVQSGVEVLRHRARATGRNLELELGSETQPVAADPVALQQITTNLVSNALDAARSVVVVRTRERVLEVSDDGPGIPAHVEQHIFEPFYSTKPSGKGTGLGLPITRRLVDSSGANLQVHTGEQGTRFVVEFAPWGDGEE